MRKMKEKNFYKFNAKNIQGNDISMDKYRGKVVLVVNTASKCGFTPQFADLEKLYKTYKDQGFVVLGFPCNQFAHQDPGTNEEILNFCQINYGVSFDMFEKIDVNGEHEHPLFKFLKKETKGIMPGRIMWNFTKFLIDRNGNVIKRYFPNTNPKKMEQKIKELLAT